MFIKKDSIRRQTKLNYTFSKFNGEIFFPIMVVQEKGKTSFEVDPSQLDSFFSFWDEILETLWAFEWTLSQTQKSFFLFHPGETDTHHNFVQSCSTFNSQNENFISATIGSSRRQLFIFHLRMSEHFVGKRWNELLQLLQQPKTEGNVTAQSPRPLLSSKYSEQGKKGKGLDRSCSLRAI